MSSRCRVVCLVGPSGVGKTSYAKRLVKEHGFIFPAVITTRKPRSDDGSHYQYVAEDDFGKMIVRGVFLEWDRYLDYYYGTPLNGVDRAINSTEECPGIVLDLTPSGCRRAAESLPEVTIIALLPDDPTWLFERLKRRNSQSLKEIKERTDILERYLCEIYSLSCAKVLVGFSPDSWESSFRAIEKIVFASKTRTG